MQLYLLLFISIFLTSCAQTMTVHKYRLKGELKSTTSQFYEIEKLPEEYNLFRDTCPKLTSYVLKSKRLGKNYEVTVGVYKEANTYTFVRWISGVAQDSYLYGIEDSITTVLEGSHILENTLGAEFLIRTTIFSGGNSTEQFKSWCSSLK